VCGIAGYITSEGINPRGIARNMVQTLHHRGPDDIGEWCDSDAGVSLGHARLSILDLSPAGHQPMHSPSGRYVLTYNGEIYNHQELRHELGDRSWHGHSDTETLLHGFERWGIEATLQRCVGMFAFALWDCKERCVYLGRDRMGEKPLYYGCSQNALIFGSELKALRAVNHFDATINRDSIALLLRHNMIPAPHSIYNGIYKLMPGHMVVISADDIRQGVLPPSKAYWHMPDCVASFTGTEQEAIEQLQYLLSQSISGQLLSDVPLGAFLSGGLDSSLVVALMQQHSMTPVKTFSIGFADAGFNEAVYAKQVAQHLGTEHQEWYVTPKDALSVIPKLSNVYDEPFADSSQIPTLLVAQLARQQVTVALSGDGADELFGGYSRHLFAANRWQGVEQWPLALRKIAGWGADKCSRLIVRSGNSAAFGRWLSLTQPEEKLRKLATVLTASDGAEVYSRLISHWQNPNELVIGATAPETSFAHQCDDWASWMMRADMHLYLPDDILHKVDRAAMAHSLESRTPYLDYRLIEFANSLPLALKIQRGKHGSKYIMRQLLYQYVPKKLMERPKTGFGLPIADWLRGALREWAESLLDQTLIKQQGYFNPGPIRQLWETHLSGKANYSYHLWDVLMFQQWLEDNA
jgi:asparagine synthase (glutamine-hydrolysing)